MKSSFNIVNKIKKNILIVDDEFINREILGAILEENFNLFYAENGQEALDVVKGETTIFSAILLDINMPVMNGFEFIKAIKAIDGLNRIPILVLTAEKDAEIKSLNLGAYDFITKPYVNEVVVARVIRAVELYEDRNIISNTERDYITGAYNSNMFVQYAKTLEKYNPDRKMDMVTVNIRRFHLLREMLGKNRSNYLLTRISDLLKAFAKKRNGIVGRGFSDYFMMYLETMENYEYYELEKYIMDDLEEEFYGINVRVRYGIYKCKKDESMVIRIDRSKYACDLIRNDFEKNHEFFDDSLNQDIVFKEILVQDFKRAIDEREFKVYYQPKYDAKGDKPYVYGAEALVRWMHPKFGFLPPAKFIELFEENGLIRNLDFYVWETTVNKIKYYEEKYKKDLPISVNVSRIDLFDDTLMNKLVDLVKKSGINIKNLHLEITESAYTKDSGIIINKVKSLRDMGFIIEMDDFGTGYSSLNMLTKMPFDYIKLDRSFINEISKDEKSYKMVELIVGMAKFLNSNIVCEGVETKDQVLMLKKLGASIIQGYYFSKPLDEIHFDDLIREE